MAPSNLNQVFVANATTTPVLTGTTFANIAASGNPANSKVGIWDVYNATPTYSTALLTTATTTAGVLNASLKTVQFTQTMLSGNMIATPLIDVKDIKRIAFTKYKAAAPYKIVADVTGDLAAAATGEQSIMIRLALRTAPTSYGSFTNPNDINLDISSDTTKYVFPLVGNFSAGRHLYSIEIPETGADGHNNTEATLVTKAAAAIQAHPLLKKIFYATAASSALTVEARHEGVIFDMTITYSDGTPITEGQTITANSGVGNYYEVLGEEKSQRSRYGNFNRMYFPMDFPTFAQIGATYDVIDISYAHAWPSSTGIGRAGELNNVRIYVPTAIDSATNVDTTFGFAAGVLATAAGTVTEYLF